MNETHWSTLNVCQCVLPPASGNETPESNSGQGLVHVAFRAPAQAQAGNSAGKSQKSSCTWLQTSFLLSGTVREFWEVGKSKSTRVPKLTKMRKRFRIVLCRVHTTVQNFFGSFCSQIICTSTFKFVPLPLFLVWLQTIENRHWYFAWTY